MYQRTRTPSREMIIPYFDGNPAHVIGWVRDVENALTHLKNMGPEISITQLLDSIRVSLRDDAAHWWDVCKFFVPKDRMLETFLKKYGGDDVMTRSLNHNSKGAPMSVLRKMDDTYRTKNPDYLFILHALQRIDCPVLEVHLVSLPLAHPEYSWRLFRTDFELLYWKEVNEQRRLCRPYYRKDSRSIWLGEREEFLRRRRFFDNHTLFCMICMSNLHHTDVCCMLTDMGEGKKNVY